MQEAFYYFAELFSMKILYVITLSELGGAQSFVCNLANMEALAGHEVMVVSGGQGEAWENLDSRVHVRILKELQREIGWRDALTVLNLLRVRWNFHPDIVHLNSSKIGMMGRLVFKPSRIVYTVHGFDSMRKTYRKLLFIEKLLKSRASAIVGVCKYDYDALLEEGITQHVSYIHNAVPDTMNSPMETEEELAVSQEMLKLHKQYGKLLMCIARDAKPKRLDMFFDLAKANPQYGFVWIGNKNEYEDKPANVHMLGSLQNASKYLRYVDLSVLISDYEGFPMSILESLSYGVPVVASNVGGVAELLNGKNGLIAENNLEDWSAKINQVLNDACLEDMSKEARKSYEQHFTIEKMVSAYDKIYNQMKNR